MLYLCPLNWYSGKSVKIKGSQKVVIYSLPYPRQNNLLENSLGKDLLGRISRAVGEETFSWPLPKGKGAQDAQTQHSYTSTPFHGAVLLSVISQMAPSQHTGPFCRRY